MHFGSYYVQKLKKQSIGWNIEFAGFVNNNKEILSESDVMVVPFLFEPQGVGIDNLLILLAEK